MAYRFLRLLNPGLNLLEGTLGLIVDGVNLVFADDGDGSLGGELFRARPPQSPVPSHPNFWDAIRPATMGEGRSK